ncbi:hypothetical protein, partial [Symbiopectobacterium sp.]|uniref:hypothetical protein n=1 Tax=Symbiopectobacterium sp. TaxID=2952789 RepID=UPI003F3EE5AE
LRMVTWGVLMLIGLQKAVINSELQNTVKSRKKKNQVRNDGFIAWTIVFWGGLAMVSGFVQNTWQLMTVRFFLGVA